MKFEGFHMYEGQAVDAIVERRAGCNSVICPWQAQLTYLGRALSGLLMGVGGGVTGAPC